MNIALRNELPDSSKLQLGEELSPIPRRATPPLSRRGPLAGLEPTAKVSITRTVRLGKLAVHE